MRSPSAVLEVGSAERGQSVMERARVCFSCGRPGHGVNRCSQVNTSFPFLSQGWSVHVDGQSRVKRTGGTRTWSPLGNEAWSGREGQPPGSSGTKVRLTPAGESAVRGEASQLPVGSGPGPGWASSMQTFPPLGSQPAEIHGQDSRKLPVLAKSVLGGRSDCAGLSDRDGRGLIVGSPPSVRRSEKWEGDAAYRREQAVSTESECGA